MQEMMFIEKKEFHNKIYRSGLEMGLNFLKSNARNL